MDTAGFLSALPSAFRGDVADGCPTDDRFQSLVREIAGYTTPAELAVLNLAARSLPAGESYLEVGTYKGRSICAALLDAPDREFVAIENFQEFGMVGAEGRAELYANLERRLARGRFRLLDGDCFDVLARRGAVPAPVGVYFYDGAHTRLAHWLALAVVEPLLADEALVLVDDASWPMVRSATERYIRNRAGWDVLMDLPAAHQDDPRWANGLLLLRFRRPAARKRLSLAVEWRRRLQVHVRGPATSIVWRTLHRNPWLVPLAKRLVPKRSRVVPSGG